MAHPDLKVSDATVVSLEYTLRLADGQVLDTSDGRTPLEFLPGQGQIIPGLERELYGMTVGDQKQVTVAAADGYGEIDPDAFQEVSRDMFAGSGTDPQPGQSLSVQTGTGQTLRAQIASVEGDRVVLDFNHPLAGEELHFDVRISGLRHATSEELAHGHVHGAGGHH